MLQARAVEMAQGLYILALTCRRGALNKIPALTGFSSPPPPPPLQNAGSTEIRSLAVAGEGMG